MINLIIYAKGVMSLTESGTEVVADADIDYDMDEHDEMTELSQSPHQTGAPGIPGEGHLQGDEKCITGDIAEENNISGKVTNFLSLHMQ